MMCCVVVVGVVDCCRVLLLLLLLLFGFVCVSGVRSWDDDGGEVVHGAPELPPERAPHERPHGLDLEVEVEQHVVLEGLHVLRGAGKGAWRCCHSGASLRPCRRMGVAIGPV